MSVCFIPVTHVITIFLRRWHSKNKPSPLHVLNLKRYTELVAVSKITSKKEYKGINLTLQQLEHTEYIIIRLTQLTCVLWTSSKVHCLTLSLRPISKL